MANNSTVPAPEAVPAESTAVKTGRSIESVINNICRILNVLGIAVLLAMTVMTVFDVIGRLFRRPIIGSTEITERMMVTIVFLCIAWAAAKGKMITVDLVTMRLSPRVQAVLNSISLFLGTGVVGVITWRSFLAAQDVRRDDVFTIILHIRDYPFMWILTVGFGLLTIVMFMQLIKNIVKAAGK